MYSLLTDYTSSDAILIYTKTLSYKDNSFKEIATMEISSVFALHIGDLLSRTPL